MTMPTDIGAIDLMISFPKSNASKTYDYLRETTRGDDESTKEFPAGYMFKDVPNKLDEGDDGVTVTIGEMDKWGVDMGLVGAGPLTKQAQERYPGRFITSLEIDPNDITGTVRKIREYKDGVRPQGADDVPRRLQPAGAGRRPSLLPDLPGVHRPRHPDHLQRRHRRDRASRRSART